MEMVEANTLEYKILLQFSQELTSLRPGDLAKLLEIRHSTINSALKRMESQQLLKWNHYGVIELLDKGKNAITHVDVHLHLIATFLMETLQYSPSEAHEESLRLAPHFSCTMIKRICDKYGQPRICPSNHEIPEYPGCHKH
jgi:Mn-dependent DtxR family transcriptional regulator